MGAASACISARRLSREPSSKVRRTKTALRSNIGRRWRRSTNIAAKGGAFASLSDADKDAVLGDLESGAAKLSGVDGQAFFELILKNAQEGFFADPIYGGNRDMCSWRMIGYPGARYDYRDWVHRHNERYPRSPVSLEGRADWNTRKT